MLRLRLAAGIALLLPAFVGAAPAPVAVLELRPLGEGGLVALPVEVGGAAQSFLFDTGGGLTTLAPQLAAAAGCTPAGRVTGFRSDGGRLDLPRCEPAHLKLAGRERTLPATILDLESLGLSGLGGLLSLASFEGEAITVDLGAHQLVLESDASLAARTASMRELRARASRQAGGAGLDAFVAVASPRGELWLELDSGNTNPVLLAPHAIEQLGLDLTAESATAPAEVELDVVGLGSIRTAAIRTERIYDGLLNARFFREHIVTFDLRKGHFRIWAAPAPPRT